MITLNFPGYSLNMKNFTETKYYKIAEIDAPATTYTVNNLQAGSKYRFQVAARNKFGYGESSAEKSDWLETKLTGRLSFRLIFYMWEFG